MLLLHDRSETGIARATAAPPEPAVQPVRAPADKDVPAVDARPPSLGTLQPAADAALKSPDLQIAAVESVGETLELTIARGDSLDRLFRRNSLSPADLAAMVALPAAGPTLARLRPGDEITIVHQDGRVLSLRRELDLTEELRITRSPSGFTAARVGLPLDTRLTAAHGAIESSLFEAGISAGLTEGLVVRMANIFQWDIDFILDPRAGDTFTVVYEERWRDGIKLADGHIVAAEYINRGESFRAARYVRADGEDGYYTPDGRSVEKAFIRAPVSFTRISSNFNPNRRHPVLNTIRAHRGVDYAAPTGTPVMAAGAGTIRSRGTNGGYGNAVVIQHGGGITTLYGHLSKFGGFRQGSRVRQGDIIGYVGQSGLATGPHLHYEYRVDGVHRNPRTVPLPPAEPVPAEYHEDFVAKTASLWQQLDLYRPERLASATD
jgi:murein DD-endopeptidase MepM/ murein hydrolase activator NlpD